MELTAGLDVGGAHLKVALVERDRVDAVEQHLCPLWQGFDKLDAALAAANPLLSRAAHVAVTMTGELSDLFSNRKQGVDAIVGRLVAQFGPLTQFWMGPRGFGTGHEAKSNPTETGSTNFLATAALLGSLPRSETSLLIDFGSTTADIIPIVRGRAVPRGLTDADRQATGELVYTGLTRTAVMGVATRAPVDGRWVSLAREYLATMADVRRVIGDDLDAVDLHATADGKGKSIGESRARLARMLGQDAEAISGDALRQAAFYIREEQRRSIADGAMQVLTAADLPATAPIIAAGIGAGEAVRVALQIDRPCFPFGDLIGAPEALRQHSTYNAPAVAVALLAAQSRPKATRH